MDERDYWLGFSYFPGIGPTRFKQLLAYFGDAKTAWKASKEDLQRSGIGGILSEKFIAFRDTFPFSLYQKQLEKNKVFYFTLFDSSYPSLLAKIDNPPFVLYVKGELDFNSFENKKTIAIVGTRAISTYGRQVTQMLVSEFVAAGCVIVSGLAIGVDSTAHLSTLEANGKTIAVLGSGVDNCTPSVNIALYNKILKNNGAIVSEFPLGCLPTKGSFPSRNRIIAGLSLGVVVTEGSEDSGALYTAKDAFANGRKVFAVPGPIVSYLSKGPYQLIARGAGLVTSAKDVLDSLDIQQVKRLQFEGDTVEERRVIEVLKAEPLYFDDIVRGAHLSTSDAGCILSMMEMKGFIRRLDSGVFCLVTK